MSAADSSVGRVKSVRLRNFRGWVGDNAWKKGVGLDADIVLINAANGRGKSSLIEAVARVLNGQGFHTDRDNQSLGNDTPWDVGLETDGCDIAHHNDAWKQRLASDELHAEVRQRATTFLQDRLGEQFEDSRDDVKQTLLKFLAPFPRWLDDYDRALAARKKEWSSEPSEPPTFAVEAARRRCDRAAEALIGAVTTMLDAALSSAGPPMQRLAALARSATGREAAAENPDAWLPDLTNWLRQRVREIDRERQLVAQTKGRSHEAWQELEAHEQKWPTLSELAGWTRGNLDLDRVLELLVGLAERPASWADADTAIAALNKLPDDSRRQVPLPDEVLSDLVEEFKRVDRARAARYRDDLFRWKTFWQKREEERRAIYERIGEAKDDPDLLEKQRRAEHAVRLVEDLRTALSLTKSAEETREKARRDRDLWRKRRSLRAVLDHQRDLLETFWLGGLDKAVVQQVVKSMDAVMRHFVVAGLEGEEKLVKIDVDVDRDRAMQLRFRDDRTLDTQMSTGQRAQMALAWLLASNALLQRWLPHRLLLLDDVSTALDLTNLAAECALLRKFAYTKSERRRQVIVASHHDQLTHRMFDLLLPPEGFSLLEIRLVDWSIESGPVIEAHGIKHTGAANETTREKLGEHLGTVFEDRMKWRRAG